MVGTTLSFRHEPSRAERHRHGIRISPFSPHRLGRSYKLALEPGGSPLFTLTPLVACWRYEPREHLSPLALTRVAVPPSPLSDRVGYSDLVRFRGYLPVHWCSGLQPPCLRFAAPVTVRHAKLGAQLLARLCRGRHLRRQSATRLQGATLIEPDRRIYRIRLSDKTSRLHPRRAATKLGQAYQPEVLVKVREWISSALASPNLVLEAQPPAQPHSRVVARICRVPGGEFDFLGYKFGRIYSPETGKARPGYRPSKKSRKRTVDRVHALRSLPSGAKRRVGLAPTGKHRLFTAHAERSYGRQDSDRRSARVRLLNPTHSGDDHARCS